jgi:hypothetical protein
MKAAGPLTDYQAARLAAAADLAAPVTAGLVRPPAARRRPALRGDVRKPLGRPTGTSSMRARLPAVTFVAMQCLVASDSVIPLVGPSGCILGLAAAGAMIHPRVLLGFVVVYVIMNIVALYVTNALVPPDTSVACHVGGFSAGVATGLSFARALFEARRRAHA